MLSPPSSKSSSEGTNEGDRFGENVPKDEAVAWLGISSARLRVHNSFHPPVMSIEDRWPDMIMQPEDLSQEWLAYRTKELYNNSMVEIESKCKKSDSDSMANIAEHGLPLAILDFLLPGEDWVLVDVLVLPEEHWKSLGAMHRRLSHGYHDLFVTT